MILAKKGFDVTIYEKKPTIGGRNSQLKLGDFTFELGPTFVMLPHIFREAFADAGKNMDDYLTFKALDPMYRLRYGDGRDFTIFFDKHRMMEEIKRVFPHEIAGYQSYLTSHVAKFHRLYRCLTIPYMHWYHLLRWKLIHALPIVGIGRSVHDVLSKFFKDEDMKIAMSFQAKYLGMSPWKCPGGFTILSYVEHAEGIHHPMGGVHKISEAFAKAAQEEGAVIHTSTDIKEILFEGRRAIGVLLENGEKVYADAVVMNADFAHGMTNLVPSTKRDKYSDKNLEKRAFSCSTFMLYLGLSKTYDIPHHNIIFSHNYRKNTEEIYETHQLSADPSFYLQNACITDSSLAPKGKSGLYVLVPVPNLDKTIDWEKEKQAFRDLIIKKIEEKTELKDLSQQIEVEHVITPLDWEKTYHVYKGAVFNLAHSLDQMLYFRPHNQLEGYSRLYLVGGGTHPGSGLPTIIESARISARLIEEELS